MARREWLIRLHATRVRYRASSQIQFVSRVLPPPYKWYTVGADEKLTAFLELEMSDEACGHLS
jgi:hypothetical protein